MKRPRRRYNFTIVFKSGAKAVFRASEVTATVGTMQGDLRSVKWEHAKGYPLHLNVADVVGVFAGKV